MNIINRLRHGKTIGVYTDMFENIQNDNVVIFATLECTEEEIKQNFIKYLNVNIKVEKIKDNIFKLTKHEEQEKQ